MGIYVVKRVQTSCWASSSIKHDSFFLFLRLDVEAVVNLWCLANFSRLRSHTPEDVIVVQVCPQSISYPSSDYSTSERFQPWTTSRHALENKLCVLRTVISNHFGNYFSLRPKVHYHIRFLVRRMCVFKNAYHIANQVHFKY